MKHLLLLLSTFLIVSGCSKDEDKYWPYFQEKYGINLPKEVGFVSGAEQVCINTTDAKYFAISTTNNSKKLVWVGKFSNSGDVIWSKTLGVSSVDFNEHQLVCSEGNVFVAYKEGDNVSLCKLDPSSGNITGEVSVLDNHSTYNRSRIDCFQPNELVFSSPYVITSSSGLVVKTIEVFNFSLTKGYINHDLDGNIVDHIGFPIITKIGPDIIDMETFHPTSSDPTRIWLNRHTLNSDNSFSTKWTAFQYTHLYEVDIYNISDISISGNMLSFFASIGTYSKNFKVVANIETGVISEATIINSLKK